MSGEGLVWMQVTMVGRGRYSCLDAGEWRGLTAASVGHPV